MKVPFPEKLAFLSEPHRYEALYEGRGGIKSWTVAQQLRIAAAQRDLRIPLYLSSVARCQRVDPWVVAARMPVIEIARPSRRPDMVLPGVYPIDPSGVIRVGTFRRCPTL